MGWRVCWNGDVGWEIYLLIEDYVGVIFLVV